MRLLVLLTVMTASTMVTAFLVGSFARLCWYYFTMWGPV